MGWDTLTALLVVALVFASLGRKSGEAPRTQGGPSPMTDAALAIILVVFLFIAASAVFGG